MAGHAASAARELPEDGIVDPVALRRSLAGERLPMTATERAVVAHHLARQGLRAAQFAYRLGLGTPTVRRLLDRGCVEYLEHHWR